MTSNEILVITPTDHSTNGWLKIIALQLAILIESQDSERPQVQPIPEKRKPGRPRKEA